MSLLKVIAWTPTTREDAQKALTQTAIIDIIDLIIAQENYVVKDPNAKKKYPQAYKSQKNMLWVNQQPLFLVKDLC